MKNISRSALSIAIMSNFLFSAATLHARASDPVKMSLIKVSQDKKNFILADRGQKFTPWGFNYDHDDAGRLIEDYWQQEWTRIEEDFGEMKDLGANVVRIHLQLSRFMKDQKTPDLSSLEKLSDLLNLAESSGLYLDITGLGCYHKKDVPAWYDQLPEKDRWRVQAVFWEAVAVECSKSPAVFCYDLMNEPVLPGAGKTETQWLLGELGGKYFVQRISLDLAGRSRQEVAKQWIKQLTAAIRKHDQCHLITVGVIPWVHVFPKAKPLFYCPMVSEDLDFASVHFYPEKGKIINALTALKAYDVGKPLVIEEMFPLKCSEKELGQFILQSRGTADGWISFYWGKRIDEYSQDDGIAGAVTKQWLEQFKGMSADIVK